ncbi:nucleolar GTP-binding protein 2-like [Babylonia areolata]|uniref:nucleolar GTP-binding protein 2-like n=1 Tax=Babylonia areolata TaxID=304850 RepID=UPI003FD14C8E
MAKPKARKTGPRDKINKAGHSMNPDREKVKGTGQNMRDKSTIKRLQMYRGGKPKRNRAGKIVKAAAFQSTLPSGSQARVEPNRKWFGNTRTIKSSALQEFQEEMEKVKKDPYKVVMRLTKQPITLLNPVSKNVQGQHILDTMSFSQCFGKKATRKRPTLQFSSMEEMMERAHEAHENYDASKDGDIVREDEGVREEEPEVVFKAGQSKRIWNELYKVIDSSDVILQVLDARDPPGTRCYQVEKYLQKEKPHKHLILVINKVDLVPAWATQKWVATLSSEFPTMAFHASISKPFGKGALINLLRQFKNLHLDKKQISVGLIGYPNVGKSSIINALRAKKVCKVAPLAGETKVWQYVTLMKRIYLVDCPGIVYPTGATRTDSVLKGVVRIENVRDPQDYIGAMLERVKGDYLKKAYDITQWEDPEDFLEQVARRLGKLLKGGEPDISTSAKMVLNDFQRGKIPYFVRPPEPPLEEVLAKVKPPTEQQPQDSKKKATPTVIQDYASIKVDPMFDTDDVQPVTSNPDAVHDESEDTDDGEDDDEEDDKENEHKAEATNEDEKESNNGGECGEKVDGEDTTEVAAGDTNSAKSEKKKAKKVKKHVTFLPLEPEPETSEDKPSKKKRRRGGGKKDNSVLGTHAFLAPTRLRLENIKREGQRIQKKLELIKAKQQKRKKVKAERQLAAASVSLEPERQSAVMPVSAKDTSPVSPITVPGAPERKTTPVQRKSSALERTDVQRAPNGSAESAQSRATRAVKQGRGKVVSGSGDWTTSEVSRQSAGKDVQYAGASVVFTVRDTNDMTTVEVVPPTPSSSTTPTPGTSQGVASGSDRKAKHSKSNLKRRRDEDVDQEPPRLSSKMRRRAEREARQQKAGKHFYSEVNVKNRKR